jgi:capsular polysaccharide biosynthesis protein
VELTDYWLAVKTGWKIVLGTLAVSLAAAAVLTWPSSPQYVSSTRLFMAAQVGSQDLEELYQRNAIVQQRVATYVEVATSSSVALKVGKTLGSRVDTGAVQAVVVPGTVILEISVTDSNPERAHDVAGAYAEVLPGAIEDLEQMGGSTEAPVQARVIDEPSLPASPVPSSVMRNLMLAVLLGLGIGVGLASLRYAIQQDGGAAEERITGAR